MGLKFLGPRTPLNLLCRCPWGCVLSDVNVTFSNFWKQLVISRKRYKLDVYIVVMEN